MFETSEDAGVRWYNQQGGDSLQKKGLKTSIADSTSSMLPVGRLVIMALKF